MKVPIADSLRRADEPDCADPITHDSMGSTETGGFAGYHDPTDGAPPRGGGSFAATAATVVEFHARERQPA